MASSKHKSRPRSTTHGAVPATPAGYAHLNLRERLFQEVDIASLVVFRVVLGALLFVEVGRFLLNGWVQADFVVPPFHFTYHGFSWVQPLPGPLMFVLFFALAAAAAMIAVGLQYRLACGVFCLGFTYVFLLERSLYLNHFYLICLLTLLMTFVPANRRFALDAKLNPRRAADYVPAWSLWLIRFIIAIPYVYGGIAKLNGDWIYGQPLQLWMSRMDHVRAFVPQFGEPWLAVLFSWGGLLLDLFVVPLLLWKPTRAFAFIAALVFHLMNAVMWEIGIFPWFMIAATTLFFEPDWPRRFLGWLVPDLRGKLIPTPSPQPVAPRSHWQFRLGAAAFIVFASFQLLFPLRHLLYPGHVDWTEEGSQFAWRMMLNDKSSALQFVAVQPDTGESSGIDIRPYLTRRQLDKMSHDPAMLRDFAAFLGARLREESGKRVEVHVLAYCTLNGRLPQLLVDPRVDLAGEPRHFGPAPWVVPLHEPLRDEALEVPPAQWAEMLQASGQSP